MIENIKARFNAKRYNIWTEELDPKRKSDFFIFGDWWANGRNYYGHPLFIFFISAHDKNYNWNQ